MRSKGFSFYFGGLGVGMRRRFYDRKHPPPFATVRNRLRATAMAFGGFKCRVTSYRVARVALRDIAICFSRCQNSFCVTRTIYLNRFQKVTCIFRGRRSTLETFIVISCGRRSTLDVSCCVCFANRIGRAASSGDNVQIPWQAWHFVTCDEN